MKIKIIAGIIAFIITIGMWYHQEISAPKDLIEIFTDDGINVKICKGGLNNCQEIKMK